MLRVAPAAAREMLGRGDSQVYRLGMDGPTPLISVNVLKADLWRSRFGAFAIWRHDAAALEKWAEHTAKEILRQLERDRHDNNHGMEM
jgi:hypothetical protein